MPRTTLKGELCETVNQIRPPNKIELHPSCMALPVIGLRQASSRISKIDQCTCQLALVTKTENPGFLPLDYAPLFIGKT